MLRGIATIFAKELIDTLRDRRTLLFMLLIPTLATPLLMGGVTRFMIGFQQRQQVKAVRIAATPEARAAYEGLVHRWFLGTATAKGLELAGSPMFQALLKPEQRDKLGAIPPDLMTSPDAFAAWCREIAGKARAGLDNPDLQEAEGPEAQDLRKLPKALRRETIEFSQVAIRGLGLVDWVDLASLPEPAARINAEALPETLRDRPGIAKIAAAIRGKEIEGVLLLPEGAGALAKHEGESLTASFIYDATLDLSREARGRVRDAAKVLGRSIVEQRLEAHGLPPALIRPLELEEPEADDLATRSDVAMTIIGGMLPFLIIFFAFLGGMYPAIDLGAGEKERNTLETLILAPTSRTEVAIGKFLVILLASLTATFLGVLSLGLSLRHILPPRLMSQLDIPIGPTAYAMVALLTIPPAAAFSGLFLAISIYARSFKEAQNYIAPLQFLLIFPALAASLPGIEMNWTLAAIPVVNVSMLFKDFLKGNVHWGYYALSLATSALFAVGCLAYAIRRFQDERVLFRS